jgi:hypothetical protein
MYQYCILYLAWRWLNGPKHVAEFLIVITNNVVFIDWINDHIIVKQNGMAPIKEYYTYVLIFSTPFV